MSPLLTVADVAAVLSKSEKWVTAAARDGVLPSRKVGRSYRFTEADVTAYVDGAAAAATVTSTPQRRRRRAA